jgi:hypothetical protein
LSEDDNGATDLGTLEKRLAGKDMSRASTIPPSNPQSPSNGTIRSASLNGTTPVQDGNGSSPRSSFASPEPGENVEKADKVERGEKGEKDKELDKSKTDSLKTVEEVEALSDMMCSLVTNNCGETRYIGERHF